MDSWCQQTKLYHVALMFLKSDSLPGKRLCLYLDRPRVHCSRPCLGYWRSGLCRYRSHFINIAGLYIGDRSCIWLLGSLLTQWRKITARYGSNLRWQPVFFHSDRWLSCGMHVDRKQPHMTADRPHSVVETVLTSRILVIIYQQAFIVDADWGSGTLSNPTTNHHLV